MKKIFVTGIDTNIGKTIVSSILVEALKADYWKPIQSGDIEFSDTMKVESLISNSESSFHTEQHKFKTPASPHLSSKIENITVSLSDFKLPTTQNNLIIEGAGGILVPINENNDYISDLIKLFDAEVIIVSKNYLGSINHTLLTIDFLQKNNIKIKGIIFNGDSNIETEKIILKNTSIKHLHSVPFSKEINKEFVSYHADKIKQNL